MRPTLAFPQDEARSQLFGDVNLSRVGWPAGYERAFFSAVRADPELGLLTDTVRLSFGDDAAEQLCTNIALFLKLGVVEDLPGPLDASIDISPVPLEQKPVFLELWCDLSDRNLANPSPVPPTTWFDLMRLEFFGMNLHYEHQGLAVVRGLLEHIPRTADTISLEDIAPGDVPDVLRLLRPRGENLACLFLTALVHVPHKPDLDPSLNPLLLFPNLEVLKVRYPRPESILVAPHGRLKAFYIGLPTHVHRTMPAGVNEVDHVEDDDDDDDDDPFRNAHRLNGFPPAHPLHQLLDAVYAAASDRPRRFPKLKALSISAGCRDEHDRLLFETTQQRATPGVRETARKVKDVLMDDSDTDWRDEWFDEQ